MSVPRKTKPGRTASKSTTSPRVGAAVTSSAGAGAMVDGQKSRPRTVKINVLFVTKVLWTARTGRSFVKEAVKDGSTDTALEYC